MRAGWREVFGTCWPSRCKGFEGQGAFSLHILAGNGVISKLFQWVIVIQEALNSDFLSEPGIPRTRTATQNKLSQYLETARWSARFATWLTMSGFSEAPASRMTRQLQLLTRDNL